ncbi:YbaK/EbsC family protein [Clostridium formicaceticum]|nr:YbaK/EbsC family protein [Clostridium formicaceticum]
MNLLKKLNIDYKEIEHEVVFDDYKIKKIKEIFKLEGIESKTLFLKTKTQNFFAFIMIESKKLQPRVIRELLDQKITMASSEETLIHTGCFPGCVAPFGYAEEVSLIVDSEIFLYNKLIFSPGVPMKTVEMTTRDFKVLLKEINNKVIYYKD